MIDLFRYNQNKEKGGRGIEIMIFLQLAPHIYVGSFFYFKKVVDYLKIL